MKNRLWLTWEIQRRNRTLSRAVDARLIELDYKLPRWRRYPRAIAATLAELLRNRPELLFAQNPSLTLALLSVWYGRITGTPVVVDAHNAGISPFDDRHRWATALARHVMRQAYLTLVSNHALADYVDRVGGCSFVLPDPLPDLGRARAPRLASGPTVLFICTWADDEPYLEVLEAASRIDPDIHIYITGNAKGRERAFGRPLPENVTLTGFVPEARFLELLLGADVIMDLTTREDCLVCGAYEAVAAGKPMVLSDTRALRQYFSRGAVYADNQAASIATAVEDAVTRCDSLAREVAELHNLLAQSWEKRRQKLERVLLERQGRPTESV